MAFVNVKGWDVEHASQKLVYENIMPAIQHINGKGVTDKYSKSNDITRVTYIDVLRVLPYAPEFRQLGATNNGGYHNVKNVGYGNSPQSTHYTIPVDLIYDRTIPITSVQAYSNEVELTQIVMKQVVQAAASSINTVTYAKQIEGFFRNGDNFDKALAHDVGSIVAGDISAGEIANAVFGYDPTVAASNAASGTNAFINANASLDEGIPEIGAFEVPSTERQAFITPKFNALMKNQYEQNASDASARILATGFINPFTGREERRIDDRTGLYGMYDGVDMYKFSAVTRRFVYIALGIAGTADDTAGNLPTVRGLLDQINGMIVYGAGTVRGIVGPEVEAGPNPFDRGVLIKPYMKMGVEVLHGATIKLLVNAGASSVSAWTATNIAMIMNTIKFTPIDGDSVVATSIAGFNDGTTV